MDITSAETKATYDEIKKYVAEHNAGMKVSNLYISQVKRKCGIEVGKNYNLPKNEDSRQPQCPEDKESAIVEALKHFNIIYSKNSPSSTGGPKFHCRRQSGINFGYVTVNGVNSNTGGR